MRITLNETVTLLRTGNVVAIPTETVYGLAAWVHDLSAIEKIYSLKKRPMTNPLIVHLAESDQIVHYASSYPDDFFLLAEAFWPGPLTIILPVKPSAIAAQARAGLETCAFRVPKHPVTRALLREVSPLVAPSANLSGRPSSTRPEHVEEDFGREFPVLDADMSDHGVESTIIANSKGLWQIVRQGAISQDALATCLGYTPQIQDKSTDTPICPGQLFRHYAPRAKLFLSEDAYDPDIPCVVGFSDRTYLGAKKVLTMGSSSCAESAAFSLYDTLRALDVQAVEAAWVDMRFPENGLWKTLRERLTRAAQG